MGVGWLAAASPVRAQDGALTAAVLEHFPPQYDIDESGEPSGFAIDVLDEVVERTGHRVRYRVFKSFAKANAALERGEVDLVPNMGITPSRQKRFLFTSPVETFDVVVFVRRASTDLVSLDDLEGHEVGVVRENVAVDLLGRRPELETRMYDDVLQALFDLLAGRIDGLAYPEPVLHKMARDAGLEDRIRPLTPPLIEIKRAIAVRRDRPALRDELDRAVRALVGSEEYQDLYARWYGEQPAFWNLRRVILAAALVLLLVGMVFFLWRRRTLVTLGTAVRERRRAEAARRKSEQRYRHLMEEASDGVLLFTSDGEVTDANRAARTMLGYEQGELLDMHAADLIDPDDLATRPLDLAAGDLGSRKLTERRMMRADGSTFPGEISSRRLDEGWLSLVRDISARRQAEEEARQREEQLHHNQKLEALGRLAGGVAHDFNNLLTAILGNAEMLLEGLPESDDRRIDVNEVREAARRGRELTQQLLAFSRRQVRKPERLSLDEVVAGMERMLVRIVGEGVSLDLHLGSDGSVMADRSQLEQLLLNLVINAKDAQPRGGRVSIATFTESVPEDALSLRGAKHPGPHVVLEVRDEGSGMDQATRDRLFEPFFTTKPRDKGTGLGLSIVHSIVEQAEGFIEVDSEPGQGSTFRVLFPRMDGQAVPRPSEEPAATSPRPTPTGTVLVVEDEDTIRRLVARVLRHAGWTVLEAASGEAALDLARADAAPKLDALVTDVVMPGLSGPELAEELAADRPGIAVLFMSGYTDKHLDSAALGAPRRAFLAKPFSPDDLMAALGRLVDR